MTWSRRSSGASRSSRSCCSRRPAGAATGGATRNPGAEAIVRAAVITVSSSRAGGEEPDESGERLSELARRIGAEVVERDLIADEQGSIEARLRHWADVERCELILTTGGT